MSPVPLPLPDPPLAEGSTLLRAWNEADASELAAAWRDPDIQRWTGVPDRRDEAAATRWINGEQDRRARGLALDLVVEVGGAVGGEVGLAHIDVAQRTAEVGWWVGAAHRRNGVATTAARLFGQWVLSELFLDSLTARCHPANPASAKVAEAAGFTRVGTAGELEVWRCC